MKRITGEKNNKEVQGTHITQVEEKPMNGQYWRTAED